MADRFKATIAGGTKIATGGAAPLASEVAAFIREHPAWKVYVRPAPAGPRDPVLEVAWRNERWEFGADSLGDPIDPDDYDPTNPWVGTIARLIRDHG